MILHIVPDEKFIDMAYDIFEAVKPKNNKFLMADNKKLLRYIRKTPVEKISKVKFLSRNFAKSLHKYEFVVIHSLTPEAKKVVLNSSDEVKFIWIGWGYDYYCALDKKLFLKKTSDLKNKLDLSKEERTLDVVKTFVKNKILYKGIHDFELILKRIDFFAPVLFEDYKLLTEEYEYVPKYLDWNYGTFEDYSITNELNCIYGNNILLGNSASYENNHIEAIDLLSKINLDDRLVICPLSYGLKEYANYIIDYGKNKLGDRFRPTLDFLPIKDYNNLISSCSVVVMNHLRQQAFGNILTMMQCGAKIFLNIENPIYSHLKAKRAIVFNMNDLHDEQLETNLSTNEVLKNCQILKNDFSKNVMLNKTKKLISALQN